MGSVECKAMADPEQLRILKEGVDLWNQRRLADLEMGMGDSGTCKVDLSGADLHGANLSEIDLSGVDLSEAHFCAAYLNRADLCEADLSKADLSRAHLSEADLSGAELRSADLIEADLRQARLNRADLTRADLHQADVSQADVRRADLRRADLSHADLRWADLESADMRMADLRQADLYMADLRGADLREADLRGANLSSAILIGTNLENANLTGCRVYGVSAWNLKLSNTTQKNIIITQEDEPTIQVDRLDIAQFIYLLLNNAEIRHVIDTITSKVVLILGRFTEERKPVLDALRSELRIRDYLPVLFDWEKPSTRDITETVSTLAHMAKFVIADITDARSIPQELMAIVPNLPSVPVQPLLLAAEREYGMFEHFKKFPWVLPVAFYDSQDELLRSLEQKVIVPAETKLKEIRAASAV